MFGEALDNDTTSAKSPDASNMRQISDRYKVMLGFLAQDNLQSWSKRHSLKILHSYLPNCKDIVVYTSYDIDSMSAILSVTYRQQITNRGRKTMTFNYSNQVYNSRLHDSKNMLYWELMATASHSITLKPQETKFIGGTLKFLSSNQYSRFFIYPGKPGSLYSCTTLSDKREQGTKNMHYSFSGRKDQSDEKILESFLTSRDLLESKIGSVGISYRQESIEQVYYLSRLKLAAAGSTRILFDKNRQHYDLEALYYTGTDNVKALESIQKIIQPLIKLKYTVVKVAQKDGKRNRRWDIQDAQHDILGTISLNYSPSFMEYNTSLTIYGM
jgi:hypothetical protein